MTSKHGESDKQLNAAEHEDSTSTQKHSQTLPLITEELAATHSGKESEPAPQPPQHVTTPVMPPNPILRETLSPESPEKDASYAGASPAPGLAAETRTATAAPTPSEEHDGKASEGRISATQLIAGAGAAATSSVIGGQLGVAGTVVGAGVASIITGVAVTIYGHSLDKGKQKIKEVGSKLAPAVKAQMVRNGSSAQGGTVAATGLRSEPVFASAPAVGDTGPEAESHASAEPEEASQTWWQKLRRKRVLYPVTIGVAAFGIGLGAVVMAESFTAVDISPGTSQISRSVTGSTDSGEESGTHGGSDGSADSGSSGSDSGPQPASDANPGSANSGSTSDEDSSTSAGEADSEGTTTGTHVDQGSNSSSSAGSDASASTSADGTDGSGGSSTSSGSQSQGGSDGSGSGAGSDGGTGGAGGGSVTGGSGGSVTGGSGGSGTGGSGGSGASSAEG